MATAGKQGLEDGRLAASGDRATDASHEAPAGLRPDGSVSTGAGEVPRGPWTLVPRSFAPGFFVMAATASGDETAIAEVGSDETYARLIAAAPDLYAALAAITSPTGFKNLEASGNGTHGAALAALSKVRARAAAEQAS